jgi:hypothetical protein
MKKNLCSLLLTLFAIILTSVNAFSQANTRTSLTSNPNPSCFGQSVTFEATVFNSGTGFNPRLGSVEFKEGAITLLLVNLNDISNVATFTTSSLSVGSHSITAVYSGWYDFNGSTSGPKTQIVNPDNAPPTIACPGTQTLALGAGCTASLPDYRSLATTSDDCAPTASITVTQSPAPGTSVSGAGSLIVTLTAIDPSGKNSTPCTFTVNKVDNISPTIACPVTGNTNRNTNAGVCTYTAVLTEFDAAATLNCTVTSLTYSLSGATTGTGTTLAGKVFNKGVTTVTWAATNGVTTALTCSFAVTVRDNQQPVITCPPVGVNADRDADAGACTYRAVLTEFNATATDNCAVSSLTYSLSGATTGTGTTLAGKAFNKGVTTVTWTATDGVTTIVTCSFTVTVADNQQPEITCPVAASVSRNTNPGVCTYTASGMEFDATAKDNCGAVTSLNYLLTGATTGTGTTLAGKVFNKGTTIVTWTASDGVTAQITCSFNVVVSDNQRPGITCPVAGNTNRNTNAGVCTYTAILTEFDAIATDNCAVTSLTYILTGASTGTGTSLAGVIFNKGVTTVAWTASDGVNPSVPCSFTVTVKDNQQPVITCAVAVNADRNADAGACTYKAILAEFNATATDNCAVTSLIYSLSGATTGSGTTLAGKVFKKGVTTVTWTATDGVTTAITCSFTVTVADNQQPVINCPVAVNADRDANAGACTYTAVLTEFDAAATDNCAVTSLTYSLSGATTGTGTILAGVVFNKGVTTVTWTATDGVTTAVTCSFTVTVANNQQPVITCPVAVNADRNTNAGVCTYTAVLTEFDATATNNCGVTSLTYSLSGATTGTGTTLAGKVFNKGVTTVTWTATDGVTTAVTCSFTVTVKDNQQPVINCPVAVNADRDADAGVCTYTAVLTEFDAIATDNCAVTSLTYSLSGATTGTGTSLAGKVFNKGVTTVTWTATDGVATAVTCSFTVTVKDNQPPVITCPVSVNADRDADAGVCTYTAVLTEFDATATDNCAVTSLTYSLSGATTGTGISLAGKVFNKGVTTVTWTATDGVTTAVTCSFTVTVTDNQQPVINCPVAVNADRNTNTGVCTYTAVLTEFDATATDNCAVTSLTYSLSGATTGTGTTLAGVVFNKGVTTVTWTATDGVTTAVTCSFTVTVKANTTGCAAPATPGAISGDAGVCRNQTGVVFSVAAVPGATSYTWTLPTGASGSSTTNSITLSFNSSYNTGNLSVKANNSFGSSLNSTRSVTLFTAAPATPGSITGTMSICAPATKTYSVAAVANATSYTWTLAGLGGASITSGQGTPTITVSYTSAFVATLINVQAKNCAGSSSPSLSYAITAFPLQPVSISGSSSVCRNNHSVNYSISIVPGATSYTWTITGGATFTGSSTGAAVTVNYATATANSATLSVKANNSCGSSAVRSKTIAVSSNCNNLISEAKPTAISNEVAGSMEARAYPNPFNTATIIEFKNTKADSHVVVEMYSSTGKKITTLFNREVKQGTTYKADWNATNLAPGIYIYKVINGTEVVNGKLVLIK